MRIYRTPHFNVHDKFIFPFSQEPYEKRKNKKKPVYRDREEKEKKTRDDDDDDEEEESYRRGRDEFLPPRPKSERHLQRPSPHGLIGDCGSIPYHAHRPHYLSGLKPGFPMAAVAVAVAAVAAVMEAAVLET